MARASGIVIRLHFESLPVDPAFHRLARGGITTGCTMSNRDHVSGSLRLDRDLDAEQEELLFDPQTSGGLLLGVPQEKLDLFLARAHELDQAAWVIGRVETGSGIQALP